MAIPTANSPGSEPDFPSSDQKPLPLLAHLLWEASPDCLRLGEMSPLCLPRPCTQNKTDSPSCPAGPCKIGHMGCFFLRKKELYNPKLLEFSGKSVVLGIRHAWVQVQALSVALEGSVPGTGPRLPPLGSGAVWGVHRLALSSSAGVPPLATRVLEPRGCGAW